MPCASLVGATGPLSGKSWPHSFSPSGNEIVFAGQRDGIWNIYTISTKTKVQKQLTNYSKLNVSFDIRRGRLTGSYTNMLRRTGNIWMLELN
jgi:Tol biopolymer transport system component